MFNWDIGPQIGFFTGLGLLIATIAVALWRAGRRQK